jgi:ABC-2 type transport system ATP-binding protein
MGKTILISSHILSELADCCTSIGIVERGQLLMHGPIEDVYRRIQRNRIIEIKVVDRLDIALSIVRSLPETRDVQSLDHRITIELEAGDEQVAALLERLLAEGVKLRSFAEKDPTLEDVFMLVTKGLVS